MKTNDISNLRRTEVYSILKATEGGMGQRTALFLLAEAGIKGRATTSCYIGHTAVAVDGGKRLQAKVSRILYGR